MSETILLVLSSSSTELKLVKNSNLLIKKHEYLGNFQKIEIEFNKQKYSFTTNLIGKIQIKNQ